MLVQQKKSDDESIFGVLSSFTGSIQSNINFLGERLPFIFFQERDRSVRFAFSEANLGTDISQNPLVLNADILHLHWTNRGFLSIQNLRKILDLGKPTLWTLHDMWTFTGGCHYTGGCENFQDQCGNCPILRKPSPNDLSRKGWRRKEQLYKSIKNLNFVTCSNWLAETAKKSALIADFPVICIPNPINTSLYKSAAKASSRKKWKINPDSNILLFGAANINDQRKGLKYLLKALDHYKNNFEEDLELVMFGKNTSFDTNEIPFKVYSLPLISSQDDLIELYSLADIFIHPSLDDNLPNMVMESLSCSTPVVAFKTGGLSDLVDHKLNGYLAEYKSAADFSTGINWILNHPDIGFLKNNARQKVESNFSNEIIAKKYLELYRSILIDDD